MHIFNTFKRSSFSFWKILSLTMILFVVSAGCSKDEEEQRSIDEEIIRDYLNTNNIQAERTASGLYYFIQNEGNGAQPSSNSEVTVVYKGYLPAGKIFDQSSANGLRFSLTNVIPGWTEGIPKFKAGGSGILFIPSHLGYGARAVGEIPANSVLIFDINLKQVH